MKTQLESTKHLYLFVCQREDQEDGEVVLGVNAASRQQALDEALKTISASKIPFESVKFKKVVLQ